MMSMTGYGRASFTLDGGADLRVELRSVNHRFLDTNVRLPWLDSELEGKVVAALRNRLSRGRVDVTVVEETGGGVGGGLRLNVPLAHDLARVLSELGVTLECGLDTAAALVQPPKGLLLSGAATLDTAQIWQALEPALDQALAGLLEMRQAEGEAHARTLAAHLDQVARLAKEVAAIAESEPDRLRTLLDQRLARMGGEGVDVEPTRLAQEVALAADRCDVSEELDRLDSHRQQMERILLGTDNVVGRKIEFLLQEFHRELNTIGSKSQSADVSHLVVESKSMVEKMRELSQNIE